MFITVKQQHISARMVYRRNVEFDLDHFVFFYRHHVVVNQTEHRSCGLRPLSAACWCRAKKRSPTHKPIAVHGNAPGLLKVQRPFERAPWLESVCNKRYCYRHSQNLLEMREREPFVFKRKWSYDSL